jgi:hypothetical protein
MLSGPFGARPFRGAERAPIVLDFLRKQGRKPMPPSNKNQERSTMAPKAIPGPLKPAERDVKCLEHKIRIGVGDAHRRLNAERIPK